MTEGMMIALITGGLAIVSNIIVAWVNNSKTLYRIQLLESKVERHNQIVEKVALLEHDGGTQWKRIDELRDEIRKLEEANK